MRGKNLDVTLARLSGSVSIIKSIYLSFAHISNVKAHLVKTTAHDLEFFFADEPNV